MRAVAPLPVIALGVVLNFFWGGNLVAVKLGLVDVPPFWSAFCRFSLAAVALATWALLRRIDLWPRRDEWRGLFVLAGIMSVQICFMNSGTDFTSAAAATVLNATNPLFAALASHFLLATDRLTRRRSLGQVLAFAGVSLILFHRDPEAYARAPLLGNLLVLASGALLGTRLAFSATLVRRMEPTRVVFWQVLLTLPVFATLGSLFESFDPLSVGWVPAAAIVYQGWVIAGLGFMIAASLYRRYPPSLIASFNFLAPVFGVWMSLWLLGESLSVWLLAGLVTVAAGLLVISTGPRAGPPRRPALD